jgi:ATP-dependent Lhr-like helicase
LLIHRFIVIEQDLIVKCEGKEVGFLEEDFLNDLQPGKIFAISGKLFKYKYIKGNIIFADRVNFQICDFPVWRSEYLPASYEVCTEISNFRNKIISLLKSHTTKSEIFNHFADYHFDSLAMNEIYEHLLLQYFWERIHNVDVDYKNNILVEIIEKDENDLIAIFHISFGMKINTLFSLFLTSHIIQKMNIELSIYSSDTGVFFYFQRSKLDMLVENIKRYRVKINR